MRDETFDPDRWCERLYRDTPRTRRYDGQTGEAFAEWQAAFRRDLRRVLGHDVVRERAPDDPDPRRVSVETRGAYERQKWTVRTEEGLRVPFYLLLPGGIDPPYPVVIALHGHHAAGKDLPAGTVCDGGREPEAVTEERRDVAVQAVRRGYAAVAPDMRGFGALSDGDPAREGHRACTRLQKRAQLYGRSLVGERVWDVLRLLDFAAGRPKLDADRTAIVGHSGGGAVTLLAAALDERAAPVAPNAYFCTFRDSILAVDHCECNYVPGLLRLGEMWDVAGLLAPRPVVVAAGARDPIFPAEATRRAFERLREIYAAVGAEGRCELHVGDGGHRFYPDGIWPFVDAHL